MYHEHKKEEHSKELQEKGLTTITWIKNVEYTDRTLKTSFGQFSSFVLGGKIVYLKLKKYLFLTEGGAR